jgi:hypothetical protein
MHANHVHVSSSSYDTHVSSSSYDVCRMSTPIVDYYEQPRRALFAGVPTAVIHVQATAERSFLSSCVFLYVVYVHVWEGVVCVCVSVRLRNM